MRRQIKLLSMALVAGFALAGCRGMVSDQPPIHINQNMDDQQRKDPQEASSLFADGRAMRPRVAGTEPVPSWITDAAGLTGKTGETTFLETLPSGIVADAAFLERGRQRYDIYCSPCHAVTGEGNGSVVARGMQAPPTLHDDRVRAFPIGQFYDVITNGVRNMPSYAKQVPPQDRWAVAAYLRVLQRSRMATIDQVPADVAAEKGWK